jgi:predicted amidophosphoribosyltransferase
MAADKITHDFRAFPLNTCEFCGGPVEGFRTCYQCTMARQYLDFLIAPSYSVDSGLESLVRAFKDFGKAWAAAPLASLLCDALERHGRCIDGFLGPDALHTWVPSDDQARSFDHMETLVAAAPEVKQFGWAGGLVDRDRSVERPRPGRAGVFISPKAYRVMGDVEDRCVLLIDDLWTSGASMASTAAALRGAGARMVGGLVLGRHLRRGNDHGSATSVFAEVERRGWAFDDCGIHVDT